MKILTSFSFYTLFGIWSLLVAPIGICLFTFQKVTGNKKIAKFARFLNWTYGRLSIWIMRPFFKVRRINMDEARKFEPCIVVCNHESILDLYMLGAQDSPKVCPVTKLWPFRLLFPFAPAMLVAEYINAEGRTLDDVEADCRARIRDGCVLVFYPEGHRTKGIGKFHTGAFRLALMENLPVVPMIIIGTGKAIPPGNFLITPGEIRVEMLPAIMPEIYDKFRSAPVPHRAFMKYVRNIYLQKEKRYEA